MDNFGLKIEAFKQIFFEQNGYQKVIEGLQNTLIIAIAGLLIGIIIGILIATVRVVPKYKILPRILNGFCSFYVTIFTPKFQGSEFSRVHHPQSVYAHLHQLPAHLQRDKSGGIRRRKQRKTVSRYADSS